jgi:phosphatidylinositol alpha-1,6-mannosyltransferase
MNGRDIRFVTKPLAPPWNDSGKNLPWCIARHLTRYRARVWSPRGIELPSTPCVATEPVLTAGDSFRSPMLTKAEIVARLVVPDPRVALCHFFFTPTPTTARVARLVRSLKRRTPIVQNVNSLPAAPEGLADLVFGDRVVVLSRQAEALLVERGLGPSVLRIAPCVPPFQAGDRDAWRRDARPTFVYAGDLEFSTGAMRVAEAVPALLRSVEADVLFACRNKTERAHVVERSVRHVLETARVPPERVRWLGEVDDLASVLAGATALVLPVDTLYAKMDLPLVALEALQLGTPCIVSNLPSLRELADAGGSIVLGETGPLDLADAMIRLARDGARWRELSEAARNAWRTHYHPEVVVPHYEELYDSLLRGAPR